MKVFLWSSGIHPVIESILVDPPHGIRISSNIDASRLDAYGVKFEGNVERRVIESLADRGLYSLGLPRVIPVASGSDLVHTISGVVPICPNPWIATIEAPSSFYGLNDDWCKSPRRIGVLKRALRSRQCKGITCFSDATRSIFLREIGALSDKHITDAISEKTATLYPAVNSRRFVQAGSSRDGPFKVLFIGNHFFDKGGRELFRAVSELVHRYDIELDVISRAPPHHEAAFREFVRVHAHDWVRWHVDGIPRKRIIEDFYPKANLFVMCSYIDLFGFVILEAMASRLPVITADVFAQRELVEHGENGFLVSPSITAFDRCTGTRTTQSVAEYRNNIMNESLFESTVHQLKDFISTLIDDEKLRKRMADESFRKTTEGIFGVNHRNAELGRMYVKAIQ